MPSQPEVASPSTSAAPQPMEIKIDLRNPGLAAFLGWLWPGAGHFYQRRYAKGTLFMVCILTTYFFGLIVGGGKVVYASLGNEGNPGAQRTFKDLFNRWPYACQVCVGLPALPAIVQRWRIVNGSPPVIADVMAPPGRDGFPEFPERKDLLAIWHEQYHVFFEMGTLYTMIAGLLNVLAAYDAFAGPVIAVPEDDKDLSPKDGDKKN